MRTSGLALVLSMMALTAAHAQTVSEPAATTQPLLAPTQATEKPAETPTDAIADAPILLEPAEPATTRPVGAAVQVAALSAPDIFSPGARNTGLSADLWKGSAADMAREILPQIGKKPLSPAAAALARRVLSTGAQAPDGASTDYDLAAARAGALLALGDAAGVEAMLERTSGVAQTPALAKVSAESALILGHPEKACQIGQALGADRDAPYWLKLRAFCLMVGGEGAAAQLTLDLLPPSAEDADFAKMMAAVMAGTPMTGTASLRSGLDMTLSRALKLDFTAAMAQAPTAMVVAIARDEAADPALRMAAAGRAVRMGANVSAVYDTATAQPAPAPNPSGESDLAAPPQINIPALLAIAGAATEARLLAIGRETLDLTQRDQVVVGLLKRSRSLEDFVALSRLNRPLIASLVEAQVPSADPVLLATAAVLAGDPVSARRLRQALPSDLVNEQVLTLDALLAAATPPSAPGQAAVVAGLVEAGLSPVADPVRQRRQGAAALTAALSEPLPAPIRTLLAQFTLPKHEAATSRLMALDMAADAGLKGETVLAVLAIAQSAGANGPNVADRLSVVRALQRAGMADEASAFAIEGMVLMQGYSAPPLAPKPVAKPSPAKPAAKAARKAK